MVSQTLNYSVLYDTWAIILDAQLVKFYTIIECTRTSVGGVKRSPTQVLTRVTCDQRSPQH